MPKLQRTILNLVAALLVLAPASAEASVFGDAGNMAGSMFGNAVGFLNRNNPFEKQAAPEQPATSQPSLAQPAPAAEQAASAEPVAAPIAPRFVSPRPVFTALGAELSELATPSLPTVAVAELPAPSVETPLHKLFCVEYARARSGLAIMGDAKLWWAKAKNLYARAAHPIQEAVMVFSGSPRLRLGHVAVVTDIVSAREIRVDQANWENHGEIDHATPVLDVSKHNDWSQVRVWDIRSKSFGAHVYPVSGFIAKNPVERADAY